MIVGTKVFYQAAWSRQRDYSNALEQSNRLCKEFDVTVSRLKGFQLKVVGRNESTDNRLVDQL